MPSGRVLNPAGAPNVNLLATDFRSAIEVRWYFAAVALVTVIVSLSWAGAYFSATRPCADTTVCRAANTPAGVFAVALLSRNGRIEPLYSGIAPIEPSFSAAI